MWQMVRYVTNGRTVYHTYYLGTISKPRSIDYWLLMKQPLKNKTLFTDGDPVYKFIGH